MENTYEKNPKLSKDLNSNDEVTLKTKIFNFYYLVLRKKDINMFFCSLLLILETFQLISYSFTTPHFNNWNISVKK